MDRMIFIYMAGTVPFILTGSLILGIVWMKWWQRTAGSHRGALMVLVCSVCLLYLLLFVVLAAVSVCVVLSHCQKGWLIPWVLGLLVCATGLFCWYVCRNMLFGQVAVKKPQLSSGEHQEGNAAADVLPGSREARIASQLEMLFDGQQIYREHSLRIEDVALRMGTNRTYLSEVINRRFGLNFLGFVNGYRVREAQRLLSSTSQPVRDIAEAVGFKNISTFNYQFREQLGQSPMDWRRSSGKSADV